MTKEQIMIDGIDVSECEHFREKFTEYYLNDPDIDYINYCCAYNNECKKYSDCNYKQLKRKEQECEELQEQLERADEDIKMKCTRCAMTNQLEEQLDQLKVENEELKKQNNQLDNGINEQFSKIIQIEGENNLLKKILTEIKEIANKNEVCPYDISHLCVKDKCKRRGDCEIAQILQKSEGIDANIKS